MLPRVLVAGRAGAGKREIFEVKRGEVALELPRFQPPAGVCVLGARLERLGEARHWDAPPLAMRLTIETLDELRVNRQGGGGGKAFMLAWRTAPGAAYPGKPPYFRGASMPVTVICSPT